MGYETKLIIGKTYPGMSIPSDNGKIMVGDIAHIELSCCDFYGTQMDDSDTDLAFFYSNSPTQSEKIEKDCYGKWLYAIDPKKVLKFMQEQNKKEKYRRYTAAIALLKPLIRDFKNENLKCILYGY